MMRSRPGSIPRARSSASGVGVSMFNAWPGLKNIRAAGDRRAFPPSVMVEIKALACELPARHGLPLAHWSLSDLRREAMEHGIVAQISGTTLWRWLSQDALRPWRHRYWIFPRDPAFAAKAGPILDLYQRRWQDKPLGPRDFVLCADEKTSIQARRRKHPSLSPAPRRPIYVEHEYARTGACAYIAAWDVHRAKLFGRCEHKTGIAPFDRLVAQVMHEEPYRSARRVFLITDNGSSHRGRRAANRLRAKWPNIILVHTPLHASWLNQIEVYFSIVQRKVLNPNDFSNPAALKSNLMRFQQRYEKSAKPFEWTFTRRDLHDLLAKLRAKSDRLVA
jgi:transposase